MASNKKWKLAPTTLTTSAANYINPPTLAGGAGVTETKTYLLVTHICVVNRTGTAATVSAFIGATGGGAAGTEFRWSATPVPANSLVEWFGTLYLKTSDFLTALAGTTTALTIEAEGEIGVAD